MKKVIVALFAMIGGLTVLAGVAWLITLTPLWPFPLFEWGYEELPRVVSPDGTFEIVPVRGNAGAVSGYTYDLFVVEKGGLVDREKDWTQRVFYAPERTRLLGYGDRLSRGCRLARGGVRWFSQSLFQHRRRHHRRWRE